MLREIIPLDRLIETEFGEVLELLRQEGIIECVPSEYGFDILAGREFWPLHVPELRAGTFCLVRVEFSFDKVDFWVCADTSKKGFYTKPVFPHGSLCGETICIRDQMSIEEYMGIFINFMHSLLQKKEELNAGRL